MVTVLFACVHNAGRSQMAAAFFNACADPARARAISAGTQPAPRVHPEVVHVMRETGIDLSSARPQLLTEDLARQAHIHVTMGCGDACPVIPGATQVAWELSDPKDCSADDVRAIRDVIREHVAALVAQHGLQTAANKAAVACTLTPAQLRSQRGALLPGLAARAQRVERSDGVVRMSFAAAPGVVPAIAAVVETERQCCRFLTFDLVVAPDEGPITLVVTAPPDAAAVLDELTRP